METRCFVDKNFTPPPLGLPPEKSHYERHKKVEMHARVSQSHWGS